MATMTTTHPHTVEYHFSLEVYIFKEREYYIAYCPSLDLTTSGDDFNDAVANFHECFQLYAEYCIEEGTLYADLVAHGWKKHATTLQPPTFAHLMKKQEMKDLMGGNFGFEKIIAPAHLRVTL